MNKFLLTLSLLAFTYFTAASQQIQKNFYQTFDIKDEVSSLKFDFPCKVEYRRTSNQRAMIETFVTWTTGNYQLLNYFIQEGEYNTAFMPTSMGMAFSHKKPTHSDIGLKDGRVIKTTVTIIVFLPESFYQEGDNAFSRCNDSGIVASAGSPNELKLK